MSIPCVLIKSGEFSQISESAGKIISPTEAKIGDWECNITNKQLTCFCKDDSNKLTYVIFKNGLSRLVLKTPGEPKKVLKKFWLSTHSKFTLTGVLFLPEGDIKKRNPKFITK